jgi:hypothetical protein
MPNIRTKRLSTLKETQVFFFQRCQTAKTSRLKMTGQVLVITLTFFLTKREVISAE